MAQTLPIPAGQPLDATWKAAGQVVTLAGAEAVAVQAAASITLAALLWPLIPAAHAVAGLASTLVLAGVPSGQAALATLAYRLVSYWLPLPAGVVSYALHRRRYGGRTRRAGGPSGSERSVAAEEPGVATETGTAKS